MDNDRSRSEHVLVEIQKLYAVERKAIEQVLAPQQIKELRLEESLPFINELGKWSFYRSNLLCPKVKLAKPWYIPNPDETNYRHI